LSLYKLLPVSPLCGSIPINLMEETMAGDYGDSGGKKKKGKKVAIAPKRPKGKMNPDARRKAAMAALQGQSA
jgi:hypothetical protein